MERSDALNSRDNEVTLISKGGVPFRFLIIIKESAPGRRSFEIEEPDSASNSEKPHHYLLRGRKHKSYTRFFSEIAKNFGTRAPGNSRRPASANFKASYRALLVENLNPKILYGYGDPAVLRVKAGGDNENCWYYLVCTSNDAPDSFPVIRSRNLTDWEFASFVFPRGSKPKWAANGKSVADYWAAEMHKVRDEFRVYFAARDRKTRELCIGVAKSSSPDGAFIAEKEPMLKDNVIDPHVFIEDDETAFLFWKKDNNEVWINLLVEFLYEYPQLIVEIFPERTDRITASLITTLRPWLKKLEPMERFMAQQVLIEAITSSFSEFYRRLEDLARRQDDIKIKKGVRHILEVMRTPIYAQKLSPDGLNLIGERAEIIKNDLPWEAHLVEGIWMTKHAEKYYLFYAGNDFSTARYGIGAAVADSPLGPFSKMPEPFLKSTEEWKGPGHPSVTTDLDGKPVMIFHAYQPGEIGYKEFRALLSASIRFEKDCVLLEKE